MLPPQLPQARACMSRVPCCPAQRAASCRPPPTLAPQSKRARASHRALLAPLKGLSQLGRLAPAAFERVADELLGCCLHDLLPADLSRWVQPPAAGCRVLWPSLFGVRRVACGCRLGATRKYSKHRHSCVVRRLGCRGRPLAEADPARTGREWRSPSPCTAIKTAVLRTLCQALVPDGGRPPTEVRAAACTACCRMELCRAALRWRCAAADPAPLAPSLRTRPYTMPGSYLPQPQPHAPPSLSPQAQADRARRVWETLEPLTDTDPRADQFAPFDFV